MTLSNAVHLSLTSDADYSYNVMGDSPDFQKARKGDLRVVQEITIRDNQQLTQNLACNRFVKCELETLPYFCL